MTPTKFEQQNIVFTKPEGWTDEQCGDLPAWKGNVGTEAEGQFPAIISCWKLSDEDLKTINETGVVWLSVTGQTLPPVAVFSENPFV